MQFYLFEETRRQEYACKIKEYPVLIQVLALCFFFEIVLCIHTVHKPKQPYSACIVGRISADLYNPQDGTPSWH